MRHKDLIEETREWIRAELEQSHADRANGPHPRPDKADVLSRALAAIEHGAIAVQVGHALYRVVGEQRPRQHLVVTDSREGILAELERWRDHWTAQESKAAEFSLAAAAVGFGALEVWADGTLYRVVEQ